MKLTSACWLATILLAAQPASTPPRMVFLDVVVRDTKGQPVKDLRSSELQVMDDGKPQEIVFFRAAERPPEQPASLGPHEYSNLGVQAANATVVVFDQRNSQVEAKGAEWDEIARSLEQFESTEALYFYILTKTSGTLLPVHGLAESPADSAIRPWTRETLPQFQAMRNLYRSLPPEHQAVGGFDSPLEATYFALHQIASQLAALPGRKSIVWIGGPTLLARPADRNSSASPAAKRMAAKTEELVALLEMAHIAVYSVDKIGAAKSPLPDSQGVPLLVGSDRRRHLPDVTGGRKYFGEIHQAIADAITDARGSYRIGYAPPGANWDGQYHRVRVNCSRRGLHTFTQDGYDAARSTDRSETRERIASDAATLSPLDSAAIGLRVELSPGAKNAGAIHFEIHVRAQDLLLLKQDSHYRGSVALQLVSYLDEGPSQVAGDPLPVDLNFSEEQRSIAMRSGLLIPDDVTLDQRVRKVRLLVIDRLSDSVGSVTMPVTAADRSGPR